VSIVHFLFYKKLRKSDVLSFTTRLACDITNQ